MLRLIEGPRNTSYQGLREIHSCFVVGEVAHSRVRDKKDQELKFNDTV